jgi:site-specific DNA recombinase
MVIAIYSRKSIYSDKSDSTATQIKLCKDYISSHYTDYTILEYEDEGYTGANTDRPGFTKLMQNITLGTIDVLICYKIDRISRNVVDFSSTFETLQKYNVEFVSIKEQLDTSTPLGRAMMYICSVFSQMERETIAERVKDNMIELAKEGKWAGGKAPIGYDTKKVIINGKKHTILEPNEEDAKYVNAIFDLFFKLKTLNALETHYRRNQIRTQSGNYFSSTQFYRILVNPCYVAATKEVYNYFESLGCQIASPIEKFDGTHGIMAYGRTTGGKKKKHLMNTPDDWIISVGLHKPIISSKKWLRAQSQFKNNSFDKSRKHKVGLLYSILKCKCGYGMKVKVKHCNKCNKDYAHYFCTNRYRRGIEYCDTHYVSVERLDSAIMDLLNNIKSDKSLILKYIPNTAPDTNIRTEQAIKKDISKQEKKIMNLTNTLQDNINSTASKYIILQIEELDKSLQKLKLELRESQMLVQSKINENDRVDSIYNSICTYLEQFDRLDYDEKNAYLKDIIKSCVWDGTELNIAF